MQFHSIRRSRYLCRVILAGPILFLASSIAMAWEPRKKSIVEGQEPLLLLADTLNESSGLAFSRTDANCVWTHNDSGGRARLMAFTHAGKPCGRVLLRGVKALDWEDMASYVDKVPRLLVADVGDNDNRRKTVSLYLFDEPDPRTRVDVDSYIHLVVRFADGAQNCEAVAVDVKKQRILLLAKSPLLATMHQVPLPSRSKQRASEEKVVTIEAQAVPIQRVAIPLATGMELCAKTGDLWISNYLSAYRYPHHRKLDLEARLKSVPQIIDLPKLRQIEAIAADDRGRVWVTSEGKPAKMQRLITAQ